MRLFAIVAGAVLLHLPGGRSIACEPGSPVVVFDGGEPPDCEVVDGPARALNLIVPAGGRAARLERLTPGHRFEPVGGNGEGGAGDGWSGDSGTGDGGATLVFVQSGGVECRSGRKRSEPGECGDEPSQPEDARLQEAAAVVRAGALDTVMLTATDADGPLLLRAFGGQRAMILLAQIGG